MKSTIVSKTITPARGTPTASFRGGITGRGKKSKIDGISVWLKGDSPCQSLDSQSPYNERAAYIVNEVLGLRLVPPTILYIYKGEVVSAMTWVCGKHPRCERPPLLVMFDYLIDNPDRHYGNWIIKRSGGVWAIDNALSFDSDVRDYYHGSVKLPRKIKKNMLAITKNSKDFRKQLKNLLDRKQITAVIERMKIVLNKNKEGDGNENEE